MNISNGKIIRFTQTFHTRGHGEWGTYEQEVLFPNDLDPALKENLEGMGVEDTCSVNLSHLEHVIHDDSLIITVPLNHLQGVKKIETGMVFTARLTDRALKGIVKEIRSEHVIIDCNLPLFGLKNVMSNIRILDIREPSPKEQETPFPPKIRVI